MNDLLSKLIMYGTRALTTDELVDLRFDEFNNIDIQALTTNAIDIEFSRRQEEISKLVEEIASLKLTNEDLVNENTRLMLNIQDLSDEIEANKEQLIYGFIGV